MSLSNSDKSAKSSSSPMISKFLQQQLQRYMQDLPKFSKSDAFYQRSSMQESPGVSILVVPGNQSVPLTCPISLKRQVVPVCTLQAPLYIDLKIQRALQDWPNNVLKAVVEPGSGELCLPREAEDGLDISYIGAPSKS